VIDLHCHLLPGIDDGSKDLGMSLAMARMYVADGVTHLACTPHIMPGVWQNRGDDIRVAVDKLQQVLIAEGIGLHIFPGADNHVVPDFVAGLKEGRLLTLANSRYVLVEPPHHVAPPRLEEFFFSILVAGYVPILTHPERLTWIEDHYAIIKKLVEAGVWMQITAGSLAGRFGRRPKSWGYRMLQDGLVHILATDAHDPERRPPLLSEGWELVRDVVGAEEAERLVLHRPFAILIDEAPGTVVLPAVVGAEGRGKYAYENADRSPAEAGTADRGDAAGGWLSRRLRDVFK
jgi:protein-tyrosine phosphatase